ncbi:hypothetical protein Slin15195_G088240 [Septoria linicola]|uniref:F-box domain-containing protein n=1 Tax=Septoria linicola TaxID=215465 RepID=A0A9Q9AUR3_9PEZI|nr:hypothetical protein Slin14017_G090850 [Septoria linicola]USW55505.1 hypothetical protein Slin15195_G088240 [Septoria linicola]
MSTAKITWRLPREFTSSPAATRYVSPLDMITLPSAAAVIANRAVFSTTELLEKILLNLTVKQLYRVRSVQRKWFETIERSPYIMSKLITPPTDDLTAWEIFYKEGKLDEVILLEEMPPRAPTMLTIPSCVRGETTSYTAFTATLNDLFEMRRPLRQLLRDREVGMVCNFRYNLHTSDLQVLLSRVQAKELPLRRFVSDPPACVAKVHLTWGARGPRGQEGSGTLERIVTNENGLTVGDLLTAVFYQKGEVQYLEELLRPNSVGGGKEMTLARKMKQLQKRGFTDFHGRYGGLTFRLYGIVAPTEDKGRLRSAGWVVRGGGGPWL